CSLSPNAAYRLGRLRPAAAASSSSDAPVKPLARNTPRTFSRTSSVLKPRGRPRERFVISVLFRIICLDATRRLYFYTVSHKTQEDAMELFASPMACSLASHITALEAGLPVKVRFVENKKTDDGGDYFQISEKGYVPALRLDDGQILNEGPSVLQYLADRKPR